MSCPICHGTGFGRDRRTGKVDACWRCAANAEIEFRIFETVTPPDAERDDHDGGMVRS